eukprot:7388676-Prymnesium_polylepis.1
MEVLRRQGLIAVVRRLRRVTSAACNARRPRRWHAAKGASSVSATPTCANGRSKTSAARRRSRSAMRRLSAWPAVEPFCAERMKSIGT